MSKDVKVFMSESDFDNLSKAGTLLKEINGVYDSKLTIVSTQTICVDEDGEFRAAPSVYTLCEGKDEVLSSEESASFSLYLKGYKRAMDKAAEVMNNAFNLDSLDEEDEVSTPSIEEDVSVPTIEEEEENTAPEVDAVEDAEIDSENE